ncbi:fimbrial biogenesis chaperone [Raoultella ornithinolytica]|uniref:fimbrial biogenesis chaperone n=1 Tax=Raoultella ornithinolytica TaxID=54291 RepID=UPI0021AF632C|nr:molecular chaperone [Raoultella ornithinolytica]MCT4737207.1 molecular chaperone [Raoultella ornithinolytica]
MKKLTGMALICGLLAGAQCQAFMLGGLRAVYNQDQKAIEVPVFSGKSDKTYLIKATLLKDPESRAVVRNFLISPPIFRLDPGQRNNLRISLIEPRGLPADRESVFYLDVTGIPSSNPLARDSHTGFSSASVSFGTGNRIKFFYRPRGVPAPTAETYRQLVFSRIPGGVQVLNPTPYNVTLTTDLVDKKKVRKMFMVPPFGKQMLPQVGATTRKELTWYVIDDNADVESGKAVIR